MRNPHTVRLDGPDGSLMITHRISDLDFTNIENGGFGSGSFTLQKPIARQQLDTYAEVLIFDGRNGNQVSGGRILTPGRSSDDQGQVANVSFLGEGPAAMGAVERPWFYIDQTLDMWALSTRSTQRVTGDIGVYPSAPNDIQSLLFNTREGVTIDVGTNLIMTNRLATLTGQNIGGFGSRHKEGFGPNANWRVRHRVYTAGMGTFDQVGDEQWDGGAMSGRTVYRVGTDWTNPRTVAAVMWIRNNTTIVATEGQWAVVNDPIIRAQLYDAAGNLRTGSTYANEYVLAGEAFTDWCVQNCPTFDMAHANITPGTYHFDQLSWPDGIDGMKLLEELLEMEKSLMWGVFEKRPNGKYRTALVERTTEVRYELSVEDGYDESGPADELCNVVYVTWTSPGGKPQVTRVPTSGVAPVPALDARGGAVQSKVLALGTEVGSTAQATQRGQEYLDGHVAVPNGGTVTINGNRRIFDHYTGRRVAPWEIEPGYVGRIAGLSPRPDTLNPDGSPDGSTRARIVSMNWNDVRSTAQLQLDAYPVDQYHLIADLIKKRR